MARKTSRRERISFIATKRVSVPTRVTFTTAKGKKVTFAATKKVSKPVRVTFCRRRKK